MDGVIMLSIAGAIEAPDIEGVDMDGVIMLELSMEGAMEAPDIEAEAAGVANLGIEAGEEEGIAAEEVSPKPESIFKEGESVPISSADIFCEL
jgi:hypothetical protein